HNHPYSPCVFPGGLNTWVAQGGAVPTPTGAVAKSESITLMGNPLCSETALQASTATLIEESPPSLAARSKYSEAGLLRPVGLNPPCRNRSRTAARMESLLCSGAGASNFSWLSNSGEADRLPKGAGKTVTNACKSKSG